MLARTARSVVQRVSPAGASARAFAGSANPTVRPGLPNATSVEDVTVRVTFIDAFGARSTVPGLVGQSLYDVATMHGMELGPTSSGHETEDIKERWTEDKFGEGVSTGWDHIQVSHEWLQVCGGPNTQEKNVLDAVWEDEVLHGSRLASQVVLTKEMEGLVAYVPDTMPW